MDARLREWNDVQEGRKLPFPFPSFGAKVPCSTASRWLCHFGDPIGQNGMQRDAKCKAGQLSKGRRGSHVFVASVKVARRPGNTAHSGAKARELTLYM